MAHGDGAPGAAVAAQVAVVAHGEDVTFGNREGVAFRELRVELPGREFVVRKSVVIGQEVGGAERGKVVGRAVATDTLGVGAVFDRNAVHVERAAFRLDGVAPDGDDPFDEVPGFVVRGNEHEHIASRGFVQVEEFDVCPRDADAVNKLANEDTVSHKQGVFHGAGGDLERLDDKGTHESKDECDGD